MRTTVDLTEEHADGDPISAPACADGYRGICSLDLYELTVKLTTPQVEAVDVALRRWLFENGEIDINDQSYNAIREHEGLRAIVNGLRKGKLPGCDVPVEVQRAVKSAVYELLNRDPMEDDDWFEMEEQLRRAQARIKELETDAMTREARLNELECDAIKRAQRSAKRRVKDG
ncbi:MAG: hypothetical protein ACHREM_00095 [Polyangiales bacterium]